MNIEVDRYLIEGCGRCPLGGTPECKVHNWTEAMRQLREILLECGLTETIKWGVPCYLFQDKNLIILSAFKSYCSISFFKGSLLQDTEGILVKPGDNSQASRLIRFTTLEEVLKMTPIIKAYIYEAIEVEKLGFKVDFKAQNELEYPAELLSKMEVDPELKTAFESLTQGRQRGYILHFTQPKQSKTRTTRIEKCTAKILAGKGLNDDYRKQK